MRLQASAGPLLGSRTGSGPPCGARAASSVAKQARRLWPQGLAGLLTLCICSGAWPACPDALPPPASGFGADTIRETSVDSLPGHPWLHDRIYLFRPATLAHPLPLIYFLHGMGAGQRVTYERMLRHLAGRGYCVVLLTYTMVQFPYQGATYRRMFRGIRSAAKAFAPWVDTTRLGMIGHSFGASAIPSHMYRCLSQRNWGSNGAFMYLMAPHYVFGITREQLSRFPGSVRLITEVFEDDDCNDHRMARDIFETIGVPDSLKTFIVLRSDTSHPSLCILRADHATPNTFRAGRDTTNVLDWQGIWRFVDALADFTFTGDTTARALAMGEGTPQQRFMGIWPDGTPVREAIVSDSVPLLRPVTFTKFNWKHPWNVWRRTYHLVMPDGAP